MNTVSLLERIQQELKAGMLAKDTERVGTLRLLKSAIGYVQMEKKHEALSDAEIIAIVQREIKKRREAAEQFQIGGRPELAARELAEVQVLETFLPQPLAPEELEQLIRAAIAELGATGKKDMGPVIKAVQAKAAGRADGKTISGMVGRFLP